MRTRQNGFSLIEMVIALAILAAATTIAIRATTHLQDQARYQQTTRSLNDIQAAIVGPANQRNADGSALVTGFVADTGRLPQYYVSGSDPVTPGDPLNELFSNPNGIVSYRTYSSNVDPSVIIGVGWQGPYLHLGAGPSFVRDGWGNSLHAYDTSGNLIATAGTQIGNIASWGSDNLADVYHGGSVAMAASGYPNDVSVPSATIGTATGFNYLATIDGQVTMNSGTDPGGTSGPTPNPTYSSLSPVVASTPVSIWVDYFGPDLSGVAPASPNPVADVPTLVGVSNGTTWTNYFNGTAGTPGLPFTGQFTIFASNVTIGPRVLKVYVLPATVTTVAAFRAAVTAGTTVYTTGTLNVTLVPGSQTINLVLPHYSP